MPLVLNQIKHFIWQKVSNIDKWTHIEISFLHIGLLHHETTSVVAGLFSTLFTFWDEDRKTVEIR